MDIDAFVLLDGLRLEFVDFTGVRVVGGETVVCGRVSVAYEDGVVALDLEPGGVLIELGTGVGVRVGEYVRLVPGVIELFPTNI